MSVLKAVFVESSDLNLVIILVLTKVGIYCQANLSPLQLMGRELNTKRSSLPGKINEKYAFIHSKLKLDHFHFNSLPFGHLLSVSLNSPRTFLHQECGIIYCIGNQDLVKTFWLLVTFNIPLKIVPRKEKR